MTAAGDAHVTLDPPVDCYRPGTAPALPALFSEKSVFNNKAAGCGLRFLGGQWYSVRLLASWSTAVYVSDSFL